jgi:hypothetical protein
MSADITADILATSEKMTGLGIHVELTVPEVF